MVRLLAFWALVLRVTAEFDLSYARVKICIFAAPCDVDWRLLCASSTHHPYSGWPGGEVELEEAFPIGDARSAWRPPLRLGGGTSGAHARSASACVRWCGRRCCITRQNGHGRRARRVVRAGMAGGTAAAISCLAPPSVRSPPSSVVFFLHASPRSMLVRPNHYEKYTATGLGRTTPEEHRFAGCFLHLIILPLLKLTHSFGVFLKAPVKGHWCLSCTYFQFASSWWHNWSASSPAGHQTNHALESWKQRQQK